MKISAVYLRSKRKHDRHAADWPTKNVLFLMTAFFQLVAAYANSPIPFLFSCWFYGQVQLRCQLPTFGGNKFGGAAPVNCANDREVSYFSVFITAPV